jgi:cell fate (sporulation/competence/biofilm development) regulator YlbF (YheA/YmcA/DUF963 family)
MDLVKLPSTSATNGQQPPTTSGGENNYAPANPQPWQAPPSTDQFTPTGKHGQPLGTFPVGLRQPDSYNPSVMANDGTPLQHVDAFVGPNGQVYVPAGTSHVSNTPQTKTATTSDTELKQLLKELIADKNQPSTAAPDTKTAVATKPEDDKPPKDVDKSTETDKNTIEADSTNPTEAVDNTPKTKDLTQNQKAIDEFQEVYSAFEESLQDPEVQKIVQDLMSFVYNPLKAFTHPFKFMRTVKELFTNPKIKELRRQIQDLGPVWDDLKTKLPEFEDKTTANRRTSRTGDAHKGHSHTSKRRTSHEGHSHAKRSSSSKPKVIPFDELTPQELAALLGS